MNNSVVSVIMPMYNAEKFIREAIESVIHQSYPMWELYIVDDGSTDSSYEIAKEYVSEKIHLISQINSGACVARNRAIRESQGEFIKFLDADDVLDPHCLSVQVAQIMQLPETQIPFGDYCFINKDGGLIYQHAFSWEEDLARDQELFFYNHWEVLISTPLHRRIELLSVGLFDEKLARGQEYDLHFRLANAGYEFVYFPIQTFSYRSHDSASRISTETKKKTYSTYSYLAYLHQKFEALLIEKYQAVPIPFRNRFSLFWFNRSRDAFAQGLKIEGRECIENSRRLYLSGDSIFLFYYYTGRIVGYVFLEKMLRLRAQFFGKNKTNSDAQQGIDRYL